ncbi:MAG: radical SAM/SPASM domain-containing protein, partial [Candidatus Methanomethylicota archaeon]
MEKAPIHIAWQTTPKCNLKCVYCYANAGEDAKADVLSTSEAKKFILEASDLGVKSIVFTGGEPLTRSDILDLIEFTSDIGLKPILA